MGMWGGVLGGGGGMGVDGVVVTGGDGVGERQGVSEHPLLHLSHHRRTAAAATPCQSSQTAFRERERYSPAAHTMSVLHTLRDKWKPEFQFRRVFVGSSFTYTWKKKKNCLESMLLRITKKALFKSPMTYEVVWS